MKMRGVIRLRSDGAGGWGIIFGDLKKSSKLNLKLKLMNSWFFRKLKSWRRCVSRDHVTKGNE